MRQSSGGGAIDWTSLLSHTVDCDGALASATNDRPWGYGKMNCDFLEMHAGFNTA
jgi:hypothetical protein